MIPPRSIYIYRDETDTYLRFVGDMGNELGTSVTLKVDNTGVVTFTPPAGAAGNRDHFKNFTADPLVLKKIWTDIRDLASAAAVKPILHTASVSVNQEAATTPEVQLMAETLASSIKSTFKLIPGSVKAETLSFEVNGPEGTNTALFKINGVEIQTTGASAGQVLAYNGTKFLPTDAASGGIIAITHADAALLISGATGLKPGGVYKVTAGPKNTTSIGAIILQAVSKTQFLNTGYILSDGTFCEVSYDFTSDFCYTYRDPRGNSLEYSLAYASAQDPIPSFPRTDTTKSNIVVTPSSSNYNAVINITSGATITINTLPALDAGVIQLTTTETPTAPATLVTRDITSIARSVDSSRPVRFKSSSGLVLLFKNSTTLKTEAGLNADIRNNDWIEFTYDDGVWLQSNISTY